MKLLLDENLSDGIISRVVDLFPDSTHIKAVGKRGGRLRGLGVGEEARVYPPKIIWLRVGNRETSLITNLLRPRYQVIRQFIESETESLLVLERPQT